MSWIKNTLETCGLPAGWEQFGNGTRAGLGCIVLFFALLALPMVAIVLLWFAVVLSGDTPLAKSLTFEGYASLVSIIGNFGQYLGSFLSLFAIWLTLITLREMKHQSRLTQLSFLQQACAQRLDTLRAQLETLRQGQSMPFLEQRFLLKQIDEVFERRMLDQVPKESKEDARECLKAWREQLIERELIEHEIESLKPPKLKGRVSA